LRSLVAHQPLLRADKKRLAVAVAWKMSRAELAYCPTSTTG
jgi:hypothetical protein